MGPKHSQDYSQTATEMKYKKQIAIQPQAYEVKGGKTPETMLRNHAGFKPSVVIGH